MSDSSLQEQLENLEGGEGVIFFWEVLKGDPWDFLDLFLQHTCFIWAVALILVSVTLALVWKSTWVSEEDNTNAALIIASVPTFSSAAAAASQRRNSAEFLLVNPESSEMEEPQQDVELQEHQNEEGQNQEEQPNDTGEALEIKAIFVDETCLTVRIGAGEKLRCLKEQHLLPQLSLTTENSVVRLRLIFNGRPLLDDDRTLQDLGLVQGSVIHCSVQRLEESGSNSAGSSSFSTSSTSSADQYFDVSSMLYQILGAALAFIWGCRLAYPQYFTFSSSMSLVFLTLIYIITLTSNFYLIFFE